MGLKSETKTVDGMTVQIVQMAADKAVPRGYRLAKVLLPQIALLASAKGGEVVTLSMVREATTNLFVSLAPDEVMPLLYELLDGVTVRKEGLEVMFHGNNRDAFNSVFNGKLFTVFKIARLAVEVNYGDFLSELLHAFSASSTDQDAAATSS